MLGKLCAELRNFFVVSIHDGTFTISNGMVEPLDFVQENQYFRIIGSVFNDGVYKKGEMPALKDETFNGAIWGMAVPEEVVELSEEIKAFCESDESKPSAYTSESFGGYSYSKATDDSGTPLSWQSVFSKKMNRYRKAAVV